MESHYLQRLGQIYAGIDSFYSAAQRHYHFACQGCTESCCTTKFYHHTVAEEMYLAEGLKGLPEDEKAAVLSRAAETLRVYSSSPEDVQAMCPLNEQGLCVLYDHRPMICRMHGVPYEVHGRDLSVECGAGCSRFMRERALEGPGYFMFNRTIFYVEVAKLERELRDHLGFIGDYRKTVADMVVTILGR